MNAYCKNDSGPVNESTTTATAVAKAQAPEPEHLYDRPGIQPAQFLLDVMHDPTVELRHRMNAACKLLRIYPLDDWPNRNPRYTVRIPDIPTLQ